MSQLGPDLTSPAPAAVSAPAVAGTTDIICLCNWHGIGGAQLNAGMLTAEFLRRGFRAELGFLFEREPDARHGTPGHFVLAPKAPKSPGDWFSFLGAAQREIIARRPRAIIGFQPMANVVGALAAARIGNCAMIATQRNPADRQSAAVGRIERFLGGTGLYAGNIAVSQTVADTFAAYPAAYRGKLRVVHNATPSLPPADDTVAQCRARFGMTRPGLVLGCLGRLHTQKNLAFALATLAQLPDANLYLAGEGPEEANLRAEATRLGVADRVHFLGSINGADITRFYRALDVLLFCSIFEGFGRVLVEAMSQGIPVVASDIAIAHEVAGDAAQFRPFDAPAWADAITRLGHPGPARDAAITAGRTRAEHFSLSSMVDGYLLAAGLPSVAHP